MDAMQNESANATDVETTDEPTSQVQAQVEAGSAAEPEPASAAAGTEAEADAEAAAGSKPVAVELAAPSADAPEVPDVPEVPQQRTAEPEAASGRGKKRKSAPKAKSAAGTKSLVVLREGKVHYADESVVVLDLDDAAHPDTDVHDVVDKLSELRDAAESAGRTEAVALVAELIQAKALA
jgi:hypothetical protein